MGDKKSGRRLRGLGYELGGLGEGEGRNKRKKKTEKGLHRRRITQGDRSKKGHTETGEEHEKE